MIDITVPGNGFNLAVFRVYPYRMRTALPLQVAARYSQFAFQLFSFHSMRTFC
jgi:hypothetical protein